MVQRKKNFGLVFFSSVMLSVVLLSLTNCSRSNAFRQEQTYYQQDSSFVDRQTETLLTRAQAVEPKKKVFVLPFFNDTPFGNEQLGFFTAEELSRLLRDSSKVIIPDNIKSSLTSADFYRGSKVRLAALSREGKKLGVNMMVIGRIKRVIYRQKDDEIGVFRRKKSVVAVELQIQLFDVINEREIFFNERIADMANSEFNLFEAESANPRAERIELALSALREACQVFQNNILRAIDKMAWEGRIAKVGVGKIYITAGKDSGINIGDILKVVTAGEDIYDPLTGNYLGKSQGQVKGTLEVIDYLGTDGAVASVHSGGNFRENDVIRLY